MEFEAAMNILQYSSKISTDFCCTGTCCFGCFTTLPLCGI
jgi:hypothetical protein